MNKGEGKEGMGAEVEVNVCVCVQACTGASVCVCYMIYIKYYVLCYIVCVCVCVMSKQHPSNEDQPQAPNRPPPLLLSPHSSPTPAQATPSGVYLWKATPRC